MGKVGLLGLLLPWVLFVAVFRFLNLNKRGRGGVESLSVLTKEAGKNFFAYQVSFKSYLCPADGF